MLSGIRRLASAPARGVASMLGPVLVMATVFPILAGCGAEVVPPMGVERVDSAGVEIIWNRGDDRPLGWNFERVLALGGEESGPESFYRVHRGLIGVDGLGNIHILDAAARHVVVFSPSGEFLRSIGGEGGGPGEFRMPFALDVGEDGEVAVFDVGKQGFVRFSPEGAVLEEERIEIPFTGGLLARTGRGLVFASHQFRGDASTSYQRLLIGSGGGGGGDRSASDRRVALSAAPDGGVASRGASGGASGGAASEELVELFRLEVPSAKQVIFSVCGVGFPVSPLFAPRLVFGATEEVIAYNVGSEYMIQVERGEGNVQSLRRDLEPRRVTKAMALAQLGEGHRISIEGRECLIPADQMLAEGGYASSLPAIAEIVAAPGGELWVRRGQVKGEPALIDLFGADGLYQGTLPSGSPLPVAFLPSGEILAIETDEMDIMRVVLYRIDQDRT